MAGLVLGVIIVLTISFIWEHLCGGYDNLPDVLTCKECNLKTGHYDWCPNYKVNKF